MDELFSEFNLTEVPHAFDYYNLRKGRERIKRANARFNAHYTIIDSLRTSKVRFNEEMEEQLVLVTEKRRWGDTFYFPFNECINSKKEIALHSIHYPSFVIPITYKLFFTARGGDILDRRNHMIDVKFPKPVNSADDVLYCIFYTLREYFTDNFPLLIERWASDDADDFQGSFPIYYEGNILHFNIMKLEIEFLDQDIEINKEVAQELDEDFLGRLRKHNIFKLLNHYKFEYAQDHFSTISLSIHKQKESISIRGQQSETVYVKCNIIKPSMKNFNWEPIIEVVTLNGEKERNVVEVINPTFHDIQVESVFDIAISLETPDKRVIPFDDQSPIVFKFIFR